MKNLIYITIILTSLTAYADNSQVVRSQQIQDMILKTQKLQLCLDGINQVAIRDIGNKGKKLHTDIKALCLAGKRREAQHSALKFAKEIKDSRVLERLNKCANIMDGLFIHFTKMTQTYYDVSSNKKHICDI